MAAIERLIRRLRRGERGAELIEMAVVTPVLLLIMAGIFDFAMMFRSWEVVTNAAREGARVGVLPAYTDDENVRARVEQYMQVGGVAGVCTLETAVGGVCPAGPCSVCVQTQTVALTSGTYAARMVTVSSRQRLPSLSVIGTFFGGNFSSLDVASTSIMRTEIQGAPAP
jgi:Flp pilus assembly protein TadG